MRQVVLALFLMTWCLLGVASGDLGHIGGIPKPVLPSDFSGELSLQSQQHQQHNNHQVQQARNGSKSGIETSAGLAGKDDVANTWPTAVQPGLMLAANYLQPKDKVDVSKLKEDPYVETRIRAKKREDEELAETSYKELSLETGRLLQEVLELSSDLAIADEQLLNPAKNQLIVLVSLENSRFFELDYVEIKIDGELVAAHPYTHGEIEAMLRGGAHRLYVSNMAAGMHKLSAKFVGKVPKDPDYERNASFNFIAGVQRNVIELYVNTSEVNSFPRLTIREWN